MNYLCIIFKIFVGFWGASGGFVPDSIGALFMDPVGGRKP